MMTAAEPLRPVSYYVYYRIGANADHDELHARVRAMQRELHDRTGINGRLLERRDDGITLMEIYEPVTDPGFEHALQHAVDAAGIGRFIAPGSARHIERFVECA